MLNAASARNDRTISWAFVRLRTLATAQVFAQAAEFLRHPLGEIGLLLLVFAEVIQLIAAIADELDEFEIPLTHHTVRARFAVRIVPVEGRTRSACRHP